MRAYIFAFVFFAAGFASGAMAQGAPMPPAKTFTASAEIKALLAQAKADRKGDEPMVLKPVLSLAPYGAQLEYRPGLAPAALHEKDAEFMYVIEGTGTIVTGGKLTDEKRRNAANLAGTSIAGGTAQSIGPGDFILVPENTPHQITPTAGGAITLVTMHVPRPTAWP